MEFALWRTLSGVNAMTAERRSSFPDDARKASASATPSAAKQHLEQKGREAAHDLKERASDLKDQAQSKLEEVRETASEKLHEARDYASEKLHEARDAAGDVVEEARDLASEKAAEAARKMREYGEQLASRQKLSLAEETRHLSLALRGAADRLHNDNDDAIASYADAAAEQLERASRYIRGHSVADLIDDAQEIVRERPGLVLGGMFIAGLAVGRFLNASASHRRDRGGASHFARNARFSATGSNGGPQLERRVFREKLATAVSVARWRPEPRVCR
jgi:vacuolar-type H+-ATPase subunit H